MSETGVVSAGSRREALAASKAKSRERSLLSYLGTSLSAVLLIFLLAIGVGTIALPAIVHGSALTVLTSSMEPKYPPGTLMVIRPTPVDDIRVGDVLTYQIKSGEPAVISHRVISKTYNTDGSVSFITKGDNNAVADAKPVLAVQVKGTLWYAIPYLGWVNNFFGGDTRTLLAPIIAGLLFVYAAYTIVSTVLTRRRKKAAAARSGDAG